MTLVLLENERYIPYLSQGENSLHLSKELIQTRYGELGIWKDEKNAVTFTVIRGDQSIEDINMPLCVVDVIQKMQVKALGLICKAGGINPLLCVGDILLVDDYIDVTAVSRRSCGTKKLTVDDLVMENPFSSLWRGALANEIKGLRSCLGLNIFSHGTFICTQGPFFESKAEINSYRQMQADVVGHSLSPYVYYAKELTLPYLVVTIVSNTYHQGQISDETITFENNDHNNTLIASIIQKTIDVSPPG